MSQWKVKLSNNEEMTEEDVGSWRKVMNYCNNNNLTISKFIYNNTLIHANAESYFVIHDMTSLGITGKKPVTFTKKGLGSIRGNKYRINWVDCTFGDYVETNYLCESTVHYRELSIDRSKVQETPDI